MTGGRSRAKLSVNVNKVATLRNSRGGSVPSVIEATRVCLAAEAPGITVHPRADARHITSADVHDLSFGTLDSPHRYREFSARRHSGVRHVPRREDPDLSRHVPRSGDGARLRTRRQVR